MYHWFLQRGIPLKDLLSLSHAERIFYMASMELEVERAQK